jgi:phytanoyl-CoA hydroxylase
LLLNTEQKEFFNTNGFLVLDNFFTNSEINDYKEALRELIQIQLKKASKKHTGINLEDFAGKEFDEGMMKLEEIDHVYVANIYDTIYQIPAFLRIPSKLETSQCVNQLFDRKVNSSLYIDTSRCRIDPPNETKRLCGWHQEVFYYTPKSDFIQTWAPLVVNSTIENGTIEVCVGSHKEGFATQDSMLHEDVHYKYIVNDEIAKKYPVKKLEMKLGQLLIFSSKLIHKSGHNTSNNVRYSLVGIYHNLDNENFVPPKWVVERRSEDSDSYYAEIF